MEKTAIVTGSSRGIGRAIASALARAGYNVCINYIERRDRAEELEAQLTAEGCRVMSFCADVSDFGQVRAMFEAVRGRFGPVSALVNNAGIAGQAQFQDISDEMWNRYFAVNLGGARNTIRAALPDMLHEKRGSIVNISSIWGLRGASCEVAYSCTKAAVIALTRSLAMELAPSGIRVNCVAPGVIDTDMLSALPRDIMDGLAAETPMGRLGTPQDIAGAVKFFLSDEASFVTGQVLTADGGFIG